MQKYFCNYENNGYVMVISPATKSSYFIITAIILQRRIERDKLISKGGFSLSYGYIMLN